MYLLRILFITGMSQAGRQSNLGDEYQLLIAINWAIKLLSDDSIEYIQVDSTGITGREYSITVDDIVVVYKDKRTRYMQAKKNAPKHKAWTFSSLKEELVNAKEQYINDKYAEIEFYSQTPFGDVASLIRACKTYASYDTFMQSSGANQKEFLRKLASVIDLPEENAFCFARRIRIGSQINIEAWNEQNILALSTQVIRARDAIPYIKELITEHESSLRPELIQITRSDVVEKLREHGIVQAPSKDISEILKEFSDISKIGRNWPRKIAGEAINRPELRRLIELIEEGKNSILLKEGAGAGKTCILLDLAEYIEKKRLSEWGLLFIKGDHFASAQSGSSPVYKDLPKDIVGQCARLSENRRVIVIIDSLDVLSISRSYDSLRLFTSLINRLAPIENITTVSACRSFDLKYDSELQGMKWNSEVRIEPLAYEGVVVPLLNKWNIDHRNFSESLKNILTVPLNLNLYKQIIDNGAIPQVASIHALYSSFIQEVVVKKSSLGNTALDGLHRMADYLVTHRSPSCNKTVLNLDEHVIRELISQGVIDKESSLSVRFSHSTLLDNLIVSSAVSKGQTFKEFILGQHQLPFIRPFVRAFLFYLRDHQLNQFSRQIRQVISAKDIHYHIKRLICESLAEIVPQQCDISLLRWLYNQHSELLQRTFLRLGTMGKVHGSSWFSILSNDWLSLVTSSEDTEQKQVWLSLFLQAAECWMNDLPDETIALWKTAIKESWFDSRRIAGIIAQQFSSFKFKDRKGIRDILESFLSSSTIAENVYFYVAPTISLWVEATNQGDDLLWFYITKDIEGESDDLTSENYLRNSYEGLRCESHIFHSKDFLLRRLQQSDYLLDQIISAMGRWSRSHYGRALSGLLGYTSWSARHNEGDFIYPGDSFSFLHSQVEQAVVYRALANDRWWSKNAQSLLDSHEDAITYIALQACAEIIERGCDKDFLRVLPLVEYCLQNESLLFDSRLADEIGELLRKVYEYIFASAKEKLQRLIVQRCNTHDAYHELEGGYNRNLYYGYRILRWIPAYFRTEELQAIFERCRQEFGDEELKPRVYTSGGIMNISPLSSAEVLSLRDASVLQLLRYYNGDQSIRATIREVSRVDPERFLNLCTEQTKDLSRSYVRAILEGASEHLGQRGGRRSLLNQLEPAQPISDGEKITVKIIEVLEKQPTSFFADQVAIARILQGCSTTICDELLANRWTFLLLKLLSISSHTEEEVNREPHDLHFTALNSYLGIAEDSTLILYNRLIDKGDSPLPLLHFIIRMQSSNQRSHVNPYVVHNLAITIHYQPDLGWQVLNNILSKAEVFPWIEAERILYRNYKHNFQAVKGLLDVLYRDSTKKNGEVWGRIAALSSLDGHITQEKLFSQLSDLNDSATEGAVQVFFANLTYPEFKDECQAAIERLLNQTIPSAQVLNKIDRLLFQKNTSDVQRRFCCTFLESYNRTEDSVAPHFFPEWLAKEARIDPLTALPLLEKLVFLLGEKDVHFLRKKEILNALVEIEREAVESDDSDLIRRTILLQDQLLKMYAYEMNELLDNADLTI